MNYNRFSYYRANPFADNDFIPLGSMTNRGPKQFISQIPQGEQYIPSKPGKRIYKQKVSENQIQKDNILKSPEKYPFENRIALNKQFSRNLDTIDIQGASSGTKVNQSIRNKHKAYEQLKKKANSPPKNSLIGESLDEIYEKKRKQLAEKFKKDIEMRKTKETMASDSRGNQQMNNHKQSLYDSRGRSMDQRQSYQKGENYMDQYARYVNNNSSKKYVGMPYISPEKSLQYQGHQRYKRPERNTQTIDHYNYNRLPERIERMQYPNNGNHVSQRQQLTRNQTQKVDILNGSIKSGDQKMSESHHRYHRQGNSFSPNSPRFVENNSLINVNNRYRSNPEYIDNYSKEYNNRIENLNKTKQLQNTVKHIYESDRKQFRRNNPTNLSFNIAAKSTLNPIA